MPDKTRFKKWLESLTPEQRTERKEKFIAYQRDRRAKAKGYKSHADFLANAPEHERKRWETYSTIHQGLKHKPKPDPMDIVAHYKAKNQRPPWEIVGWTRQQYHRWLKRLEAQYEHK